MRHALTLNTLRPRTWRTQLNHASGTDGDVTTSDGGVGQALLRRLSPHVGRWRAAAHAGDEEEHDAADGHHAAGHVEAGVVGVGGVEQAAWTPGWGRIRGRCGSTGSCQHTHTLT